MIAHLLIFLPQHFLHLRLSWLFADQPHSLRAFHTSPVDRVGSVTGMNFALGSYIWEILARFPRWEKVKDPGDEFWRQIRETKQTWRNTKILTFGPILPSVTLKAVSLQLNGMLMMWKIQQAMQDDAIRTARIHLAIHPAYRDLGWKNRDLGNRASPPSHMNTSKILQRI